MDEIQALYDHFKTHIDKIKTSPNHEINIQTFDSSSHPPPYKNTQILIQITTTKTKSGQTIEKHAVKVVIDAERITIIAPDVVEIEVTFKLDKKTKTRISINQYDDITWTDPDLITKIENTITYYTTY